MLAVFPSPCILESLMAPVIVQEVVVRGNRDLASPCRNNDRCSAPACRSTLQRKTVRLAGCGAHAPKSGACEGPPVRRQSQ